MVSFAISHPSEVHALLKGGGTIAIGLRTKPHAGSINSEAACDLEAVEAVETIDVTNEVVTSSFSRLVDTFSNLAGGELSAGFVPDRASRTKPD